MDESSERRHSFGSSDTIRITGTIMIVAIIVLFVVFVFVLFLHLYAKWFLWRTEEPPSPHPNRRRRRRRFVFAPGQDPTLAARKGLDPAILGSLPVLTFDSSDFKDGLECAVCLSELEQGEKARLLPKCNHGFHVECIDMWFQSHSTCPLCRNTVALEGSESVNDGSPEDIQSSQENLASGISTESPNFPTNVLFWGNETQVSTGGASLDGTPSSQSQHSSTSSSSSMAVISSRQDQDRMLVIDIPVQMSENLQSLSPSRFEEESKSPMTTRLRSLKRLLSREKKSAPSSSSSSVDV
ncbi:RING-H2 finger protein ATL60-like [Tripterygium wilfordii]|uniref:RING-type E3 ubiquitin transferase n=1 Tax=Tripterygium wilfordii TaxID=458696 RepID=A0A7J7CHG3_TRIWF|nr:RING-H2 finger protein ATL3-like [Tripterygium wilfordii]KAF5733466.1 RING-H2 finger protein ATL60-like [Tripterygium wilfordii]